MSGRIRVGFIDFIVFHQRLSLLVAFWRVRFWCEGAGRERSLQGIVVRFVFSNDLKLSA
jgi:hypothetical protein